MAKLNKKTSTSKKMKSSGAGYSTTNRQGVQTFYKSSKDAPGYSDTQDGKNVATSLGKPIGTSVINSDTIKPVPDLGKMIPAPAPVDSLGSTMDTANAYLANANGGTYDTKTKQMVPAPTTSATGSNLFEQYLGAQKDAFDGLQSQESLVKEQQRYLKPKENLANSLQGQLNVITANRDAQMLGLEGQGRGQTGSFIGGEQARINREAAIQAMPIQAQLAIAQADLDSARSYASQLFQAKSQDALARYNYQKEVNSTIFSYLNQQEQRALAVKDKEDDRAFAIEQANRNNLKDLAMQAIEFEQGALAGEIMKLDPNSPTFDADTASVMSRLRKPVSPTSAKAPDLQNFGTTDNPDWRQYNSSTGSWDEVDGVGIGSGTNLSKVQKTKISDSIAANKELDKVISEYKSLIDDVGFEGSTFGGTNLGTYKALKGKMTTILKSAETLGTLDEGVRQLVNDLVGDIPEKGGFTQNLFGFKSRMISSQLATTKRLIEESIKEKEQRLNGGDFSGLLTPEDESSIYEYFGVSQSTDAGTFDPDQWLN